MQTITGSAGVFQTAIDPDGDDYLTDGWLHIVATVDDFETKATPWPFMLMVFK